MGDVRLGITGLGVGTWHLESFKATPGAEVIALCDIDASRLNGRGDADGIRRRYPSVQEILADRDVEAVSVCRATPSSGLTRRRWPGTSMWKTSAAV